MGAPFPTKWSFILGTVLIGVNRADGTFSGSDSPGEEPMVHVFTTEEAAKVVPADQFDLQSISVSRLVAMLPTGLGIMINAGSAGGTESMHVDPNTVQQLKPLLPLFPPIPGAARQFEQWESLKDRLAAALAADTSLGGIRFHALRYTIEDSPPLGVIAFDGPQEADEVAQAAIASALAVVDQTGVDVASINVVPFRTLPDDVRATHGGMPLAGAAGAARSEETKVRRGFGWRSGKQRDR